MSLLKNHHSGGRRNQPDWETVEMDEEDRKTFDDDVKEMKKETAKKKTKVAHLKLLMDSTFSGRRHWIQREMPPVTDIVQKFPALKIPRLVC